MKKVFLSITLILLLSTSICFASTTSIVINNQQVNFTEETGQPFIANDHTLVPMRVVMEQYGCTVTWSQSLQTVTITKGDAEVKVPIGQEYILVNNQAKPIEVPGQVINGKTYLPIRAVLEGVGAKVEWDNNSKSVVVSNDVTKNNINDDIIKNKIIKGENQQLTYEEFINQFDVECFAQDYSNQQFLIYKKDITKEDLKKELKNNPNLETFGLQLMKELYDSKYFENEIIFKTSKDDYYVVLRICARSKGQKAEFIWFDPHTED